MAQVLIVGCGYTGRRIASKLKARGDRVRALVRSQESARALADAGISAVAVDLDRPPLPELAQSGDRVFYLAPPPNTGATDPRMRNFLGACSGAARPERILYFSTTGVYGDCHGDWVDESWPANPGVDRARRRRDAEEQLAAWRRETGGERVILRVAGIYGPHRLPLDRLRKRLPLVREEEAPFTNRIHVDDLVDAAIAAMDNAPDDALFNACDGHPSTMNDYFDRLADLAGLERAPVVPLSEAADALSPGMLSYMRESRRLSNRRLVETLGLTLRYPTLADGLPACFEHSR